MTSAYTKASRLFVVEKTARKKNQLCRKFITVKVVGTIPFERKNPSKKNLLFDDINDGLRHAD